MNKIKALALIALFFILANNAFAENNEPALGPYTTIYGSTEETTTFAINQKPAIFFQFEKTDMDLSASGADLVFGNYWLVLCSDWEHLDGSGYYWLQEEQNGFDDQTNPDMINYWFTLDTWEENKQPGGWHVHGTWISTETLPMPTIGQGDWDFTVSSESMPSPTVTPEPISSLLFVSGISTLLIRRKTKKTNFFKT